MATASAMLAQKAKMGSAQSCTEQGTVDPLILSVMRTARALSPTKTSWWLADVTKRSVRTVKYWLAGQREPSMLDAAKLLRSEEGFQFLVTLMAEAEPAWWAWFSDVMEMVEAQRLQAAAQERMARRRARAERLLNEATDASRINAQAIGQAALLLHDTEFYRERLAPLGQLAGVQGRPVAASAKGRGRQ